MFTPTVLRCQMYVSASKIQPLKWASQRTESTARQYVTTDMSLTTIQIE